MTDLSHRAEQAAPEEARELLEELMNLIHPPAAKFERVDLIQKRSAFRQFLSINTPEAHLAAAMMLVPEGMAIERFAFWPASPRGVDNECDPEANISIVGTSVAQMGQKRIWGHGRGDVRIEAKAATPALALIAAIARSVE